METSQITPAADSPLMFICIISSVMGNFIQQYICKIGQVAEAPKKRRINPVAVEVYLFTGETGNP